MRIMEELQRHLVPLSPVEFSRLEENIIEQGAATVPLVFWNHEGQMVLLDGHNRYTICKAHNLPFETRDVNEFAEIVTDLESAKDWIDRNQLGRRNLTPEQFQAVLGRVYNRRKKAVNDGGKGTTVDQIEPRSTTAEEVGNEFGVSAATVKRAGQRAEVVDNLLDAGETEAAEIAKRAPQSDVAAVKDDPPEQAAKKLKDAHVRHNSGNNEWYTPQEFLEAAREVLGEFDLDPASSETAQRRVGARTFYTAETDGLQQHWEGRVWMNPPYAADLIEFKTMGAQIPRGQAIALEKLLYRGRPYDTLFVCHHPTLDVVDVPVHLDSVELWKWDRPTEQRVGKPVDGKLYRSQPRVGEEITMWIDHWFRHVQEAPNSFLTNFRRACGTYPGSVSWGGGK